MTYYKSTQLITTAPRGSCRMYFRFHTAGIWTGLLKRPTCECYFSNTSITTFTQSSNMD